MVEASVGWLGALGAFEEIPRCPGFSRPGLRGNARCQLLEVTVGSLKVQESRNPGVQVMDGQLGTKHFHFHPFFTCFI